MKRKEMVEEIKKAIDEACGNDGENRLYPSDDYLAEYILQRVERLGMTPPTSYHELKYLGSNEWEPEK